MKKFWKSLGTAAFWVGWPVSYLHLRFSRRSRILVTHGDNILVVKNWLGPNEWSLPGGGIHPWEDQAKAAARELHEETDIKIKSSEIKPLYAKTTTVHGFKLSYECFSVRLPRLEKFEVNSLDIVEIKWFNRAEVLDEKLSPETRDTITDWLSR